MCIVVQVVHCTIPEKPFVLESWQPYGDFDLTSAQIFCLISSLVQKLGRVLVTGLLQASTFASLVSSLLIFHIRQLKWVIVIDPFLTKTFCEL